MRGAAMSSTMPTRGVIILFTAAVVYGQPGWEVKYVSSEICAVQGSTVEMKCSYEHPSGFTVKKEFWFIHNTGHHYYDLKVEPNYSNRVEYHCQNKICSVKIKKITENDKAVYKFRFLTNNSDGKYTGVPGVSLSVTDLNLQERVYITSRTQNFVWFMLECQASCDFHGTQSYIWSKNKQDDSHQVSKYYLVPLNQADTVSCGVTSGGLRSPKRSFKQREFTPSTKICSFSGSTVKIRCHPGFCSATVEYDTHWAKGSDFKDRVKLACDKNDCTLSISDLRDNDPDEFFFIFNQMQREERSSIGLILSVKDLRLNINVRQTNNHLELECTSNCQLPDNVVFQWYKNGQTLHEKTQNMILRETSLSDSYQCALQGHWHRSLQVYAPRNVSVTPSGEIKEDSLVNLTCSCDAHPAATFAWYKMDRGQKPFLQNMEPNLIFRSIKSTDSGHYQCTAENDLGKNSKEIFIDVKYAPRSVSVSMSPSGDILEGQSVTLNCSSDANPSARNTWYKNDKVVSVEPHGIYSIISVKSGNIGDYYCKSENEYGHSIKSIYIKVQYAPKRPSLSMSPSGELLENSEVTLTCSSDANPPANYTWYKKGKRSPEGSGHNFIITKTRLEQSGYYYCEAQNKWGRHNTTIHLTIVPESQKTVIIGIISVISLAIILLIVLLLLRKRRSASSLPEPTGRPKSSEQGQPGTVERQDHPHEDVCYASVHFLRKQTDPIYCNIRPVGAHKLNEEEDESVEYSVVKFSDTHSVSRTEDQPAEDPASLYSPIRKFR